VPGVDVYAVTDLRALCAHLAGAVDARLVPVPACTPDSGPGTPQPDMADVIGQRGARRALEVAAAGGHHLLMVGPPGAGKSMLAARLPGLLPPMTDAEALASAALLSASAVGFSPQQWRRRPFRAPHHSSSAAALIGGRNPPQPGEITLTHSGVLFLDELPEFDRHVLETLREPLEAGSITISRAAWQTDFPAACQLVAAMNPCPCGWRGDPSGRCRCTPETCRDRVARNHAWRAEHGHRRSRCGSARAPDRPPGQDQSRVERPRDRCRVPARRPGRSPVARGGRAFRLVGAGVLPRAQGGAHDRRPRGRADARGGACCRSGAVSPCVQRSVVQSSGVTASADRNRVVARSRWPATPHATHRGARANLQMDQNKAVKT
jgi:energy-coupling factor transporter ATP-binding protein EcfA2